MKWKMLVVIVLHLNVQARVNRFISPFLIRERTSLRSQPPLTPLVASDDVRGSDGAISNNGWDLKITRKGQVDGTVACLPGRLPLILI